MSHAPHSGADRLLIRPQAEARPGPAATDGQIRPKAPTPSAGPVHMRVTSIATGASLNTRPDVPPRGGTSTTTQSLNAPSRHSDCCAHTHSASHRSTPAGHDRPCACAGSCCAADASHARRRASRAACRRRAVPVSFEPCWAQVEPERVNTYAAPAREASLAGRLRAPGV